MKGAGMKGAGKLTDEQKLKIYPAIIAVLGIGLAASLLSHFEVQIWTEPGLPQRPLPEPERSPVAESSSVPTPAVASPLETPAPRPTSPASPATPASPAPASAAPNAIQGSLRVSNQTDYPVRVALLPKQPGTLATDAASKSNSSSAYLQPVHWDFAPKEGELKGLRLSLPDGTLQIQAGDVLVAFAQDGSRRYWGPYVVGQTSMPTWNKPTQEWQLNLQP
ncbi:MAG TPA: hypothetical protein V6C57_24085 [Coleofasciculaceae cyanobacterium]